MNLSWPGYNRNGVLLIELPRDSFRQVNAPVEFKGECFNPKTEFHVTLIGSKTGHNIIQKINHDKVINALLKKSFEKIDWSYSCSQSVHILSRSKKDNIQKSIIMRIEMPGMTEFYAELKYHGLIENNIPVPPPHVTLYTQNCPTGIGVPSIAQLNRLTTKILTLNEVKKTGLI